MSSVKVHQTYHLGSKLQKRVISDTNFVYRNLIGFLGPLIVKPVSILDVGCGVGTIDFYLASKGNCVVGVDISKRAIEIAKENSKLFGFENNTEFLVSQIPLDFQLKRKFDLIILSEVLEHIRKDSEVLKKLRPLLKQNGNIVISVPLKNAPLARLGMLSSFDRRVGHVRRYGSNDIFSLVEDSNFKIRNHKFAEGVLRNALFTNRMLGKLIKFLIGPLGNLVSVVDEKLVKMFGPSQVFILASK